MSRKSKIILIAFLVSSSLLLVAFIIGDWLPWLRGPAPETSEWYWPYLLRPISRWLLPILSAIFMWFIAAWWLSLEKTGRRKNLPALAGLMISSLLLQLALIYSDRPTVPAELVDRTLSNLASGFFEPAASIENMGLVLQNYPQEMLGFVSEHARTHPPGLILGNWLTIKAFSQTPVPAGQIAQFVWPLRCTDLWLLNRPAEVAAALGFWSLLPLLAAALTPLPAFALARLLLHGRAVRLATVLAATIPALLLFAPKSVQLYAPLTLTLFYAFQAGLNKRSYYWMLFAGLLLSLMTFLSLGNTVLLPLLILYSLSLTFFAKKDRLYDAVQPGKWFHLIKLLLSFAIGSISIWLIVWIAWGASPIAVAQTGLQQHYELVTNIRRYDWWVLWNLVDLFLFAGWPMMLGFLGSLFLAAHLWRRKGLKAVDILALSILILVVFLNFSGSTRGEAGRIWLFFMPLLAYPAARFWKRFFPGKHAALTIIGLQLLLVVSLGIAWRPVRAVIVVAEEPAFVIEAPQIPLDVKFMDEPFSLAGFSLNGDHFQPGEELALTLIWRAIGPAQRPYTVFNHLLDEQGTLAAQHDNWPVNGSWPPTCWRSGDTIVDPYTIPFAENLPPGQYHLYSGLYDAFSGERLLLLSGADSIKLQTITISED
jgi:hypothetical protein